ncbi:hypothetical protein GCM10010124_36960 [Pilimelia terevasa]|uniref:Core-binding (CB) domain-containing protein n=1 Tax=Pilimelia terevasa TaxID=53372 RepID=A0A8J3BQD0_9ACTN|nr:hypothetical protein GCM10010124_36960 [Pilimelia terevasa]
MNRGLIFKRCGCVAPGTQRKLGRACPRRGERGHGSWYYRCTVPTILGRGERVCRGGFTSKAAAQRARDELLALPAEERAARTWTLARWLEHWLATRVRLRPTTRMNYAGDIRRFLIPHLGAVNLGDLTTRQISVAFSQVAEAHNRFGKPHSACTLAHLRSTLRAALNTAIREGLIIDNPARRVETPTRPDSHARVWTEQRVADWRATGTRPTVAVWTAEQLAEFLDSVRGDGHCAIWRLIALRGLRRGEAAGLRWEDIDFDRLQINIVRQRVAVRYDVCEGPPKSAAGTRVIAIDKHTASALRAHQRQQRTHGDTHSRYCDTGYVFTRPDGRPAGPPRLSHPAVPSTRHPIWATTGTAARPTARRRHPRPHRRRRPQNHPGPARPLHHHRDSRHLHQRPTTNTTPQRRSNRATGPYRRRQDPQPHQAG